MGVISKIFTNVSEIYNIVNPLTLSGVNDIIVIKRKDGTYHCSPFQLRFSRLQFINSKSQIVHLFINGQITDVNMAITSQGDLYFEETVDFDVTYLTKEEYDESMINTILDNELFNTEVELNKNVSKSSNNLHIQQSGILQSKLNKNLYSKSFESLKIEDNLSKTKESQKNSGKENLNPKLVLSNFMNPGEINQWRKERLSHLKRRAFSKNLFFKTNHENYFDLSLTYEKFYYLLISVEHFEFLMRKSTSLLMVLEDIYNNSSTAEFHLSKCLYVRLDQGKPDQTFSKFITRKIEDTDNLVVMLHNSLYKFYLTYYHFCKIFFEVRLAKNKKQCLLKILEELHNENLGWNIFGQKKPIKRDIQFTMVLNSKELGNLNLNYGRNEALFKISGMDENLEAAIYLWDETDKIVVSDIDGTITKSDVWGLISSYIGTDWTHLGIASLFSKLHENGYKIIYLSARSLGQSANTKEYLYSVEQDNHKLPDGPILLNPDGLFSAIYREIIAKNPDEFKIHVLNSIKQLFSPEYRDDAIIAGFGNKLTDVIAYKTINIPTNRIYTINSYGQIQSEYSKSLIGTYSTLNEFIDTIFPNINSKNTGSYNTPFNEFKYWVME